MLNRARNQHPTPVLRLPVALPPAAGTFASRAAGQLHRYSPPPHWRNPRVVGLLTCCHFQFFQQFLSAAFLLQFHKSCQFSPYLACFCCVLLPPVFIFAELSARQFIDKMSISFRVFSLLLLSGAFMLLLCSPVGLPFAGGRSK